MAISSNTVHSIAAPPNLVFDAFSNFEAMPSCIKGIKNIEVLTAGPLRVGTQFRETRKMHGHDATEELEITAFDRPRMYAVSCRSCGCLITTTFRFVRSGEGTRVSAEIVAQAQSWFAKLLSPLSKILVGMIQKCVTEDILDLKRDLESSSAAV